MKKIFAFVLAIILLCPAALADVQSQVNAPETHQAEYQSNTGRTKITVNATVYVPEVENIPTYSVTVRDFTVKEGIRLTQLLHPDLTWERWTSERDLPYDAMVESYVGANNQYERREWNVSLPRPDYSGYVSLRNDYIAGLFTRQPDERVLEYQWTDPDTNLFFYTNTSSGHVETMGKTLNGQPLSVGEATEMANAFMEKMTPDYELRAVFGIEGEKGDAVVYPTLAYCFTYTRDVGAVPITYADFGHIYTNFEDRAMAPAPGQEYITLVVHGNQIVNFHWQDPYEIGEIIQPRTELMSFEQIMSVFGTIAPLSVQSNENDARSQSKANNGMSITEIRLGYMPVLCRDNPNQWELRPVWDFMGNRILPLATYNYPCYSLLTIDAMDGTIIDRNYGY